MRLLTLMLAVLFSCWLASCGNDSLFGHGYQETESKLVYAASWEGQRIYWLDQDRVFVPGYAPDEVPKDTLVPRKLYILNTRTNTYQAHAELGEGFSFCYQDGFISYTTRTENNRKTRYQTLGKFGEEQPQPANAPAEIDVLLTLQINDCPTLNRKERLRPEHYTENPRDTPIHAIFLRKEDGYLAVDVKPHKYGGEIYGYNYDHPYKLYRPGDAPPLEIPILAKEMQSNSSETYAEWAKKYVLLPNYHRSHNEPGHFTGWPRGIPYVVYLLSPDGQVEERNIPYDSWQPRGAYLTKAGVFWFSNNAPSTNSKQAGGWLLKPNGKIVKLFSHLVLAAGVSPDGCKIAYANHDFNPKTREYVSVINVCQSLLSGRFHKRINWLPTG